MLVFGQGNNDIRGSSSEQYYKTWSSMLRRCYSHIYQKLKPTYKDCIVCEEWKLLSNFKMWFDDNYVEGWVLDKDLLGKNCKLYSPETCVFIPSELNAIMIKYQGKYNGVTFNKRLNKYIAQISKTRNGVRFTQHIGCFDNESEAVEHYNAAKNEYLMEVYSEYSELLPDGLEEVIKNWR